MKSPRRTFIVLGILVVVAAVAASLYFFVYLPSQSPNRPQQASNPQIEDVFELQGISEIKTEFVFRNDIPLTVHAHVDVDGSDPEIDFAKKMIGKINSFLCQDMYQKVTFGESISQLKAMFKT